MQLPHLINRHDRQDSASCHPQLSDIVNKPHYKKRHIVISMLAFENSVETWQLRFPTS